MNNHPKNWTIRKLGDLCIFISRGKAPVYAKGESYAIKSAQVYNPLRLEDCPSVTEEFAIKNAKFAIQKGDVLLNGTGTGTLGRSGYVYSDLNKLYIPDSHVNIIRTDKTQALGYFIFLWLNSKEGQDLINRSFSGSTNQIELSANTISNFVIPLPPLDEQKRIIAKLEVFLEDLNRIKNRLEKTSKIKNNIFDNAIKNSTNDKDSKLGTYLEEGRERVKGDWENKRRIGVSSENGITDLRSGTKVQFDNYKVVHKFDFVYNPMRINIGSIALYLEEADAITSPDYVVFRLKSKLTPFLLIEYLKSKYGLREIANNTQGSVRERLYFENLSNVNVPFLDEEEINQLEATLKAFNKFGGKKKIILDAINNLQQTMFQKAFTGKLSINL